MEAPDVIYLPKSPTATGVNRYCDWEEKPIPGYENIEYIRKKALLEWVKNEAKDITGINYEEGNYEAGKVHALWEVIDKINSL